MVSIHKVPVIVFLIIRVICFIYRFKREALHCLFVDKVDSKKVKR